MYLQFAALAILTAVILITAVALGKYLFNVYSGNASLLYFLKPVENFIYGLCRVRSQQSMNWKQYALALTAINLIWWLPGFLLLLFQAHLPLNPVANPSMSWDLAFNSTVSFLTSTNLQHYSGESGATYFTQIGVFIFLQFVSAATSLAAGVAIVRGFIKQSGESIGNFFQDLILSIRRVLLPLCILCAILNITVPAGTTVSAHMIVFLFQPLVCLGLTGIAISVFQYIFHGNASLNWFSNNGPHNFTTALYEFPSSYAGNGSGFESLGNNTIFWNLTTSFAMLRGRFVPIFGCLYIAGLMRKQIYTPFSAGTLKTDTFSFSVLLFFVIVVLQSLSMFSCFVLGPINEHLHLIH